MSNHTYAIIGTGALGGYYGGSLAHAGHDVHFLLRSDYQHVTNHGLRVDSPKGNMHIHPANAYNTPDDLPPCDIVVVCLKTTQNDILKEVLPKVTRPDSLVLMLQNGMGNEQLAGDIVGHEKILGGLCFLCSNKIAPGHIKHLDYGKITLGRHLRSEQPDKVDDLMRDIANDFEQAGIEIELIDDLKTGRWKKLVWNIPYNGLSVVLDATTDILMSNPQTRALVEDLMTEVLKCADACGCTLPPDTPDLMLGLTQKMEPYRTSMKIDYDERRELEVEYMFGEPLRQAIAAGFTPIRIQTLYRQLSFLNNKNITGAT